MTVAETIALLRTEADPLRNAGVVGLYLFGSVARGTAVAASDVDIFVDPDYGRFDFASLLQSEIRLQEVLGRKVDLMTGESLHPLVRPAIERDAIRVF